MARLIHMTDIHLNSIHDPFDEVAREALSGMPDAPVVITGDISIATDFVDDLREFCAGVGGRKVFFVLGNHDCWHGSVAGARSDAETAFSGSGGITYLPAAGVVELDEHTALCGVNGWYDGIAGNAATSMSMIRDWIFVDEFKKASTKGNVFADHKLKAKIITSIVEPEIHAAEEVLRIALDRFEHAVFATHVPPFAVMVREREEGVIEFNHRLPWYTCVSLGKMIDRVSKDYPMKRITILSGHNHVPSDVMVRQNVRGIVGLAEYHHAFASWIEL